MKINYYTGNIKNTKKAQIITVAEFLNKVKYETYKPQADKIAAAPDKPTRQKLKSELLPYVTISGVFSERNNAGLLEYSGLIAIDIDAVEDLPTTFTALCDDIYSFAVFKSVSGTGLCVLIKTSSNPDNHLAHFRFIEQYYYDQFNLVIDAACKDISRPRYVSADKNIYINEKAKAAGKKRELRKTPPKVNWVATETQMDRIVTEIVSRGINIADTYEDYLTVAFALADGYQEQGRTYFHAVCSMSDKYNPQQADKKFDNALKTRSKTRIGSFFYLCKQAGIELRTDEERTAFAVAKTAKKSRSDVSGAVQTAEKMGLDPVIAEEIAKKVFERDDLSLNDADLPVIEEIAAFLKLNARFERNEITRLIVDKQSGRDLDNILLNTMYVKAKAHIGNKVNKHDIESIIYSDATPNYNPFQDFIDANNHLPDKPEIIDDLIATLNLRTPAAAGFVRRWLLAIPAVIDYEVVRIVLTLIGGQETGKTEWFRRLLPPELKPYFGESNLMRDKDDELAMASNLIILDDEMGGKSKKDSQKFKEMTSKEYFMLREPYGRNIIKLPRLALLCTTTNDPQVIVDSTGNTRILPVEMAKPYNFEAYNDIDKTQLFIELVRARKRGESWKLDKEEKELLQDLTIDFESVNVEKEYLLQYFKRPEGNERIDYLTTTEIKTEIELNSRHKFYSLTKLGIELRKLFERKKKYHNGSSVYKYKVHKIGVSLTHNVNPYYESDSDDLPF